MSKRKSDPLTEARDAKEVPYHLCTEKEIDDSVGARHRKLMDDLNKLTREDDILREAEKKGKK
jgi:hypothetical protein